MGPETESTQISQKARQRFLMVVYKLWNGRMPSCGLTDAAADGETRHITFGVASTDGYPPLSVQYKFHPARLSKNARNMARHEQERGEINTEP